MSNSIATRRGDFNGQKLAAVPETLAGLRGFCAVRGISTNDVATEYGATQSWVSRLMRERRRGSESIVRRLRRAVGAAARKQGRKGSSRRRWGRVKPGVRKGIEGVKANGEKTQHI